MIFTLSPSASFQRKRLALYRRKSIHGDIGHGSGDRHHDEDHTAGDRSRPNVTRHLIEQSVEDRQDRHHHHEPEYHVDIQPDFRSVAPIAVERRSRREEANVVDEEDKRKPQAVRKRADEHNLPFFPSFAAHAAVDADRVGNIEDEDDRHIFERGHKHPFIERSRRNEHETEILMEDRIANLNEQVEYAEEKEGEQYRFYHV